MLQRYNIALLPTNIDIHNTLIAIAQDYFKEVQDQYLLGNNALPHVTLCQFYAESESTAINAAQGFLAMKYAAPEIHINCFQIRAGTLINAGTYIAEYNVTKDPALMDLQKKCADYLDSVGIANKTPCVSYSPHFTLARLREPVSIMPDMSHVPNTAISTRFALGLTSATGVFVEEIKLNVFYRQ